MPPMPPFLPDDDEAMAVYEGWHDCAAARLLKDTALPAVPPRPLPGNNLAQLLDRNAAKQAKQAVKQASRHWKAAELEAIEKEAALRFREEHLGSPGRDRIAAQWREAQRQVSRLAQSWPEPDRNEDPADFWKPLRYGADLSLSLRRETAEAMSQAAAWLGLEAEDLANLVNACARYGAGPTSEEKARQMREKIAVAAADLRSLMLAVPDNGLKDRFEEQAESLAAAVERLKLNRLPPPNDEGYEPEAMALLEGLPKEILEEMAETAATSYEGFRPQRLLAIAPRWIVTYEIPSLSEEPGNPVPYPVIVSTAAKALDMDYPTAKEALRLIEQEGATGTAGLLKPTQPGWHEAAPEFVRRWLHENTAWLEHEERKNLQTAVTFYAPDSEFGKSFNAKRKKEAGEAAKGLCRALAAGDCRRAALELLRIIEVIRETRQSKHKNVPLSGLHAQVMRLRDNLEQRNGGRVEPERQTGLW